MEIDMTEFHDLARRTATGIAAVLLLALALPSFAVEDDVADGAQPRRLEDGTWQVDVLSPVYTVDREYKSMTGPWTTRSIQLGDGEELLWVLGYSAVMAGPD